MVGAIVFTSLADKIGRKPVHLGCQYAMIVVGLAIAFAPEYITFVVLRFLLGALREVGDRIRCWHVMIGVGLAIAPDAEYITLVPTISEDWHCCKDVIQELDLWYCHVCELFPASQTALLFYEDELL